MVRKLILKNGFSVGDIVMLTAAVRDLHRCYPRQFLTDVRTSCPELWENNPYLTPLSEGDSGVEVLECVYPLIDRCNTVPYHCLHGFVEFLNERLGLQIKPTLFKGDIHLSELEKSWHSQVYELTRREIPYWIVAAGGKYDIPIKWWNCRRYQQVIDHFRGRVQFVQVGAPGHFHPRLRGAIDLRGKTTLRELVRLVYHAQGVLCGVTSLMHLAAAVPAKKEGLGNRPCVVIAGGREPAHWEAYPGHQFIATNDALRCCMRGGCWKSRVSPLGDGHVSDQPENLCVDVVRDMPRCMDLIRADEVIRRINLYFQRGMRRYLSGGQKSAARQGLRAARKDSYDETALTLENARIACEQFIQQIPDYPGGYQARGVVICAGGVQYFTNAWICIHMLRRVGCDLPVQVWHLGGAEMDAEMRSLLASLNVECIDAFSVRKLVPVRRLSGWGLKPYAILFSSFREVLYLDADNMPVRNPEYLFDTLAYQKTGAIFWPDFGRYEKTKTIWDNCGLILPEGPEFESGQIVVDKNRCWRALRLALWFNEHSDFYYQHLHGDKETFRLAFHKLRQSYGFVSTPVYALLGTMCQHDFSGRRVFQHRNTDKWDLHLRNAVVAGFRFEAQCRRWVMELRQKWDGRMGAYLSAKAANSSLIVGGSGLRIKACMISCRQRRSERQHTLQQLAATDWGREPVHVQLDEDSSECPQSRQCRTAWLALRRCATWKTDYILFLEDDLDFNLHLRHNLARWEPLEQARFRLAGLYNPGLWELASDPGRHCSVVAPNSVFGSQAFLIARSIVPYLIKHWEEVEGLQDIKISRLAARWHQPLFYHVPSLVQHRGHQSTWGGRFHQAWDFDPTWKA